MLSLKTFVSAAVLGIFSCAGAQAQSFLKIIGGNSYDAGNAVAVLPNDDIVIGGATSNAGIGQTDAYLSRLDADGNLLWALTFGTEQTEWIEDIALSTTNSLYICGGTNGNTNADFDYFIAKYAIDGQLLWYKQYPMSDWNFAKSIAVSEDAIYLAGETYADTQGGSDGFLTKYDLNGTEIWTKKIEGTADESFRAVTIRPDGSIVAAATVYFSETRKKDAAVICYDADGNTIWNQLLGGTEDDEPEDIAADAGGGVMVVGYTKSFGNGSKDGMRAKLFANGAIERFEVEEANDNYTQDDVYTAVHFSSSDNVFAICGSFDESGFGNGKSECYMFFVSGSNGYLFPTLVGGTEDDFCNAVATNSEGNAIIVGNTDSFGADAGDILLARVIRDFGVDQQDHELVPLDINFNLDITAIETQTEAAAFVVQAGKIYLPTAPRALIQVFDTSGRLLASGQGELDINAWRGQPLIVAVQDISGGKMLKTSKLLLF